MSRVIEKTGTAPRAGYQCSSRRERYKACVFPLPAGRTGGSNQRSPYSFRGSGRLVAAASSDTPASPSFSLASIFSAASSAARLLVQRLAFRRPRWLMKTHHAPFHDLTLTPIAISFLGSE